jgi:hypothetical protein
VGDTEGDGLKSGVAYRFVIESPRLILLSNKKHDKTRRKVSEKAAFENVKQAANSRAG